MNKILLCCFLIAVEIHCLAQTGTSSPYSRFGLGDLQGSVLPEYNSLGGGVTAFSNPLSINPYNPASYTSYGPNSFLFSTGGMHKITNMITTSQNQVTNNTAFSHITIGFPIHKKIGGSVGILPYTNMGYESNSFSEDYDADLFYSGDGGISKIYFGGAYKLSQNLSFGINASYLFGVLNNRKKIDFNDETFLNSRSNSKVNIKGYCYEIGFLYNKKLEQDKTVSVGLTANNNSVIRAKRNKLIETFEYSGAYEIVKDTALNSTEWGDVILPQYISAGILYRDGKKWLFLGDYSLQNWAEYRLLDQSDNLNNSMRISGGIGYIPEYNSPIKYYKRIQYRIGFVYSHTPLQFENNQLSESSISIGVGMPVKKSRTKYDVSLILGKRGTTEDNLIEEQFVRLGLSVSYDGIWFVKRKYD